MSSALQSLTACACTAAPGAAAVLHAALTHCSSPAADPEAPTQTEGDSGLHRRTNSERMPPSPFSASSQKAEQQPKCCGCVVQ